ncbi:MAG: radical SAM protein [Candidatus Hydrogenedentes bacterium]|nr:radical SAM protein [Candidatus Hydrogenedentota bacterium]
MIAVSDETAAPPTKPIAVIFLHPDCNMTCTFCITDDRMDTMTFAQAQRLLGTLRERAIDNIVLGGGEPFAWPHDTLRLAAWARSQGFFVQAGTNGIAMPETRGQIDHIDRYVLPLDAADPTIHNQSRRYGPGHHELVLTRLAALRAIGKSVTISTVVTGRNVAQLPALGALLSQYAQDGGQLHAWHLYKFLPEGRGGRTHAQELQIDDPAYDAACTQAKQHCTTFQVFKRRDMRHSKSVDFYWHHRGRMRAGSELW